MPYLLDTTVCIALIKRKHPSVLKRLLACDPGDVAISSISITELRFGAEKSQFTDQSHGALDQFLASLTIVDFDEQAAGAYGAIRWHLESKGTPIGPLDTLLAAQAVAHGLTLVTNNEREFRRVKRLKLENWLL